MKILLDTHVLIWIATLDKLSNAGTAAFYDRNNDLYFSMASYWEMAIKVGLGKLSLTDNWIEAVDDTLRHNGIRWLPIGQAHCQRVTRLPKHHNDPFDRMLIAQALVEEMTLMTADARIQQYAIATLW